MDERERYREIIEENIEYEIMKDRPDGDRLGEIVEIMLDAVCSTGSYHPHPMAKICLQQVVKSLLSQAGQQPHRVCFPRNEGMSVQHSEHQGISPDHTL